MTVEDRLVEAFKALDQDVRPDAAAWSGIEARLRRRPWWRRMWIVVVALAASAGGGVGAAQLLAPASRPSVDVATEKPDQQALHDEAVRIEEENQKEQDALLSAKIAAAAALHSVDWGETVLGPLGCNAVPGASVRFQSVVEDIAYVADSGGPALALVAARCDANGSPPFGIFVYGPDSTGGGMKLVQTIVAPNERLRPKLLEGEHSLRVADGGITLDLVGYSSPSLCGACADQVVTRTWRWSDGRVDTTSPRPLSAKMSSTATLSFDGLGPIRLGMTLQEASTAGGIQIVKPDGCQPDSSAHFVDDPFSDLAEGHALFFGVSDDRIVAVAIHGVTSMVTDKGIHNGSTRDEALAAYPDAVAGTDRYGNPTLTVTDPRGRALQLFLYDGVVGITHLATSVDTLPDEC